MNQDFIPRRLRLGMIGGGPGSFMGPVHRMAARLDDRWSLVAGAFSSDCRRNDEAARAAFVHPSRTYHDWREMIAQEGALRADRLDAIAVVTPNHLHAEPCIAALEAGFDVICDKPLASGLDEAEAVGRAVARTGRRLILTLTYSAYPMVRLARTLVATAEIGRVRLVEVEYAQGWLSTAVERSTEAGAVWRTDPALAGAGGVLADIGTHAYHLAGFVSGRRARSVFADVSTFVEGRAVPDNAHLLLRYEGRARGMMWVSQVAPGRGNDLRFGIHGDAGSLEWRQETPNQLLLSKLDGSTRILERGRVPETGHPPYSTRLPAHHPEGYLEAFGQLYADAARMIVGDEALPEVPGVEDGIEGLRFVAAALASSQDNTWRDIEPAPVAIRAG